MVQIVRPTLLVDEEKCRAAIKSMAAKARKDSLVFRPHFKTHQSHQIGRLFREEGVERITVSSVQMAQYFALDGWKDITIAFPLNPLEWKAINQLAATITLNVCAVNAESIVSLKKMLTEKINIFIEIDSGYHRTGISPDDGSAIHKILEEIESSDYLSFVGFLAHAGHSYKERTKQGILKIHQETKDLMVRIGDIYQKTYPELILSIGDTPSCSVADDFSGVSEIRPGNFVFYDLTQTIIGSCQESDIAVAMACPVVATYPERKELIIHGGAVHFSKDNVMLNDGNISFGKAVKISTEGWNDFTSELHIKSLSQEHGIISGSSNAIKEFKTGDVIGVLPVHSCLTADLMGSYTTLKGERVSMMQKSI